MISRTHIRQFLAVVDTGSFTRAARRINVAQPTLSAGIAELERQLDTQLFIREKRRILLTEAANRLLPLARNIERDFRLAETRAMRLPVPKRPIRLGVLISFPTALLEQVVSAYAGDDPLEVVEETERGLARLLANGSLNIALTIIRPDRSPADVTPLFREPYRLALPQHHRLAREAEVAPDALAGETMMVRRSCEVLHETSQFFTERGIRPPFSLRSMNDDRVMAMVRAGLGITVAPESLGGPGIAMPLLAGFDYQRTIGLVYGKDWQQLYGPDHPLIAALEQLKKPL